MVMNVLLSRRNSPRGHTYAAISSSSASVFLLLSLLFLIVVTSSSNDISSSLNHNDGYGGQFHGNANKNINKDVSNDDEDGDNDDNDDELPNIIIFFADNLGYSDIGIYEKELERKKNEKSSSNGSGGGGKSKTPNIDRIGYEGIIFHNWNSVAALCSASRASLLTGKYPVRTGVYPRVFEADAKHGLLPNETTLAEYLKQEDANYRTSIVGKWHLGQRSEYLPTRHQGFDEWMGIPYHMSGGSIDNDHVCHYDTNQTMWLPLYQNETIIEQPVQLSSLAQKYVSQSIDFIQRSVLGSSSKNSSSSSNRTQSIISNYNTHGSPSNNEIPTKQKNPFFLYMSFSHVHQLCAPNNYPEQQVCQWAGGSKYYGNNDDDDKPTFQDAVEEMDWIAGQILNKLDELDITNNTLVLFTSDNGPWVAEQSCSGKKGPYLGKWLETNLRDSNCTACPSEYISSPTSYRPRLCILPGTNLQVDGIPCGEDTGLGSIWEANLRMPAFIRYPNHINAGRVESNVLVATTDVVPTLLSIIRKQKYKQSGKKRMTRLNDNDNNTVSLSRKLSKQEQQNQNNDNNSNHYYYGREEQQEQEQYKKQAEQLSVLFDGIDISDVLFSNERHDQNYTYHSQIDNRTLFLWRDGFQTGPLHPPYGRFDVVAVKKVWMINNNKNNHNNSIMKSNNNDIVPKNIKAWIYTKSAHYNDDLEQYHNPPLLFDTLKDPAEEFPLDAETYSDVIDEILVEIQQHKQSIKWTFPLCLEHNSKYYPCSNPDNQCRNDGNKKNSSS